MAGRGGDARENSQSPAPQSTASPRTDAAWDLLTGLYADEASSGGGGGGGAQQPRWDPEPISGSNWAWDSSSQEQPDFLTGVFPAAPAPAPLGATSAPPASQTGAWNSERFGFGSDDGSESSGNNPFLEDAAAPHSAPSLDPAARRAGNEATEAVDRSGRAAASDGLFAKFFPFGDEAAEGNSEEKSRARAAKARSVDTGNSSSPPPIDARVELDLSATHSSLPSGLGVPVAAQSGPSMAESSSRSEFRPPANGLIGRSAAERIVDDQSAVTGASMAPGRTAGAGLELFFGAACQLKYRAPVRGAVHPGRPVSLELRPHPLRGALVNQAMRLASLGMSVWVACDLGLMIWDVDDATGEGYCGRGDNVGDEDAASYTFLRVKGSATSCVAADVASRVVWTGHRDGKMRAWRASAAASNAGGRDARSPILSFQAHRFAVTALLFTPYGELWAGSESGDLKCWPAKVVAKALSGVDDDPVLMERSSFDLRMGNFGAGPTGPVTLEVRFLVGDHAHGRVWCAGYHYVAIWDARTRECLKLFPGIHGLDLNSLDLGSPGGELLDDDDFKAGYVKVSGKKDKGGWLQRSRNAVMGAADAVKRVAIGAALGGEESRKLEALVAAADGTLWGGYGNGFLAQWDWEGNKLWGDCLRPVSVRCICAVGNRLWIGYSDGKLQVLSSDTNRTSSRKLLGSWVAHRLGVVHMAVCGCYVFSLGLNGSIRGWYISSPDRTLNDILVAAMSSRADAYTRQQQLRVLAATWNTAEEKSSILSAKTWLAPAAEASLVVVGLQEVEMGAGALGMAVVKESVGMGQDKVSASGLWWFTHLDSVLGEGKEFERVGSRQLAGILIGVWVRRNLLPYVGDVEVGAVACGFGRTLGNKGAVGVKLSIFRRTICVLSSHLAAQQDQTARRNADFEHIYNYMSFGRAIRSNAAAGVQNMWRAGNTFRRSPGTPDEFTAEGESPSSPDSDAVPEDVGMPEMSDADLLIWTGDLNYRIDHLSFEDTVDYADKQNWDVLLSKDQLRYEMRHGRTFQGLGEAVIRFPPTYKFDKGTDDYDTSEKRRIPAWCDRVLFRDSFGAESDTGSPSKQGLTRPCKASVLWYEACMEPRESDHKPVRCLFNVDLSVTNEVERRREYGHLMRSDPQIQKYLAMSDSVPETVLSTNKLVLEGSSPSAFHLTNGDRLEHAAYVIICAGGPTRDPCPCGQHTNSNPEDGEDDCPRGSYGFPLWLQVVPATGVLRPGESIAVSIAAEMRQVDRNEDQIDKAVILVVYVKGIFSSAYEQHKLCVSLKPSKMNSRRERGGSQRRPPEEQHRQSSECNDSPTTSSRPENVPPTLTQNTIPDFLL